MFWITHWSMAANFSGFAKRTDQVSAYSVWELFFSIHNSYIHFSLQCTAYNDLISEIHVSVRRKFDEKRDFLDNYHIMSVFACSMCAL